jgi:hypothetical protein
MSNLTVDFDHIFSFTELDDEWKKHFLPKVYTHECKTGMTAVYINLVPEDIAKLPDEKELPKTLATIKQQMSDLKKRDEITQMDYFARMFIDWIIHACDYKYTDKSTFEKAIHATCIKCGPKLIDDANKLES